MLLSPPLEATPLKLQRIDFPATLNLMPGPPDFALPPSPWVAETALPESVPSVPGGMPEDLARRFVREAEVPLLEQAAKAGEKVGADLAKVGAPLAVIRVVEQKEERDDGSAVYFLISSLVLFSTSALVGYVTRKKIPYSISDHEEEEGGRPARPLLVLPVAPMGD